MGVISCDMAVDAGNMKVKGAGEREDERTRRALRQLRLWDCAAVMLVIASLLLVDRAAAFSVVGSPCLRGQQGSATCASRGATMSARPSDQNNQAMSNSLLSRRQVFQLAGAFVVAAPLASGAEDSALGSRAPMGADVLDRPNFRKRQDFVLEEAYNPESLEDIPVPVNGKQKTLSKLKGSKATIVMNIKLDDPETVTQIPALKTLVLQYADQGLNAICFPTDQGDYEPDDSATVRIKVRQELISLSTDCILKVAQQYGMKSSLKGPIIVTDKTDIVGKFTHPLYR